MKKQSYVPTTLGQYLNENRSITLTRKYGEKQPVVVGSRAPLRNAVLSYVAENAKVSRATLKKYVAGLNETSKNPNAAANMWLKRNARFFVTESKAGVTTYKLSKLGEKLVSVTSPVTTGALSEETKIKSRLKEGKDHDFKDEKTGEKGITDEDEVDEECMKESREERVARIVEQIRAKRAAALNEAEDEEEDEAEDEAEDEEEDEAEDEEEDEGAEEEAEGEEEEEGAEEEAEEDDDRVEITEFIITVDDVASAIEELGELGIEASEVSDELAVDAEEEDELGYSDEDDDLELGPEGGDEAAEEVGDFDLDLEGDFEGEEDVAGEEELDLDVEESVTGMEDFEKSRNSKYKASPANLTEEEDDEFKMDDLEDFGAEEELPADDIVGDEAAEGDELDLDVPDAEGEDLDLGDEAPIEGGEQQIKVDASNWEVLKGWLEGKGVDIEEMFGGEIEVEGEEGDIEDEISFDGLEDAPEEDESPEHEAEESDEEEADEEAEGDDDEEVDESITGMENFEKKRDKEAGDKPANLTK